MKDQIEFLQQPSSEFPTLVWRFAKTMAETTHSYVVRSPENEAEYVELFHRIGKEGIWQKFNGRRYKYLILGEFRYWRMTNAVRQSRIINRAKAETEEFLPGFPEMS